MKASLVKETWECGTCHHYHNDRTEAEECCSPERLMALRTSKALAKINDAVAQIKEAIPDDPPEDTIPGIGDLRMGTASFEIRAAIAKFTDDINYALDKAKGKPNP